MNILHIAEMRTWTNACGAPPGVDSYYATVRNFRGFLESEQPYGKQFVCCPVCVGLLPMLQLAEVEL